MKPRRWLVLSMLLAVLAALLVIGAALAGQSQPEQKGISLDPQEGVVYNSPWTDISPGETLTFTHNLGGDPSQYAVELWYQDTNGPFGINHRAYGGMEVSGQRVGAYWSNLTSTTIRVKRNQYDTYADQVHLRIWQPEPADYDSGWNSIDAGEILTLPLSLGGVADDYLTGMYFQDTGGGLGIHQYAFGGMQSAGIYVGAAWQNLTSSSIQAFRYGGDGSMDQLKVFINQPDTPPDYDSTWIPVNQGETEVLNHSLGGNVNTYLVRVTGRSTTFGINMRGAGGLQLGSGYGGITWQNLTSSAISVYRYPNDPFASEVRVRIWKAQQSIYLPLIINQVTTSSELAYDDGFAESYQSNVQGSGFAVRFTTPGASAKLLSARFYLQWVGDHSIEVHVWDINHNDLLIPAVSVPYPPSGGEMWYSIDLSSYNLTVSDDFYVGFLSTASYDPTIGVDTTSPDGRSYEVPWEEKLDLDYMIRVVLQP